MLTRMSDSPNGDPPARSRAEGSGVDPRASGAEGPGVLAGLPRIRPQRASARRVAARAGASRGASPAARTVGSSGVQAKSRKAPPRQTKQRRPARRGGATAGEPVPRQGFEAEPDALGGPVEPPGGTELIASAAELAGELAKSGVTTSARLLKDFLSRLPG